MTDAFIGVDIKYGRAINQDYDTINKTEWDESGIVGLCVDYEWDHEKRKAAWPDLWPEPAFDSRVPYRAYIELGSLPRAVCAEFTATDPKQRRDTFIAPDSLGLVIDPVRPRTLGGETLEFDCYGFVKLSFAGNGYFTWQPLARYWENIRRGPTIPKVLEICRETFPVRRLDFLPRLKSDLGELFLNRDEYREGDWIVSVSETG